MLAAGSSTVLLIAVVVTKNAISKYNPFLPDSAISSLSIPYSHPYIKLYHDLATDGDKWSMLCELDHYRTRLKNSQNNYRTRMYTLYQCTLSRYYWVPYSPHIVHHFTLLVSFIRYAGFSALTSLQPRTSSTSLFPCNNYGHA
jgi:hypothetical protein